MLKQKADTIKHWAVERRYRLELLKSNQRLQPMYHVIYDGNCNLCVTFTQLLEKFDRGQQFDYVPMQNEQVLNQFNIAPQDCQMGVILIDASHPKRRWQGSSAVEEIANLLPMGAAFLAAYRALPGVKWLGDRTYEQVRDNRYSWFGKRNSTYHSAHPIGCSPEGCEAPQ